MEDGPAPMSLAGSPLGDIRHVCALFNNDDEEYRVLLPFVKDGFSCGHKAVHIVNPGQRDEHRERLASVGIDPDAAEQRGQLEVRANTDTYLRDGRFDPDRMLEAFSRMASGNASPGFGRSRIICRMDWADRDRRVFDDVIEFESRVNDLWRRHDDAVVCTYHLGRLSGDAVVDIMRTHPMVILGGTLQHNPFYVPPAAFLAEFRERRANRPPRAAGV